MPSLPSLILILIALPVVLFSQSCCNDSSACPSNASCLCQYLVDSCIYQIVQQSLPFSLTPQTNYFNWVPSTGQYISVTINICSNDTESLKAGFKIQSENATGYPTDLNIFFSTSNSQCYSIYIASPKFCETPSGGYCNLILSLIFNKNNSTLTSSRVLNINVSYIEGLTKYIVFILIAIGSVLLLAVVILVACMIRKKMIGNPIVETKEVNTTQHLDHYTVKGKLGELRSRECQEACCVCLSQIQMEEIVRITPCGHVFHTDCVDLWCVRNLSCPICREPLDQQSLIQKKHQHQNNVPDYSLVQIRPIQQHQNIQEAIIQTENVLINKTNKIPINYNNSQNKSNSQNISEVYRNNQ